MRQKLIQDIIHDNIELSDFESLLLKEPIINRLHQILQNSAAYTVYPNMKASRFEHSLGVMNYSGKMYRYGIINSDISLNFLEDKANWLSDKINGKGNEIFKSFHSDEDMMIYQQSLKTIFNISTLSEIGCILKTQKFKEYVENFVGKSFVIRNLESSGDNFGAVNILFYQTVRLFGLLHDIGHLPLSHLFEFSIDSLQENLTEQSDKSILKGEASTHYYNKLTNLLGGSDEDQIHEIIGKKITKFLFHIAIGKVTKETSTEKKDTKVVYGLIVVLMQEIWQEIIKGKQGYLNSLYGIVSATIDSDRIDYVQRDGYLSGITKHVGNVNRIIEMFCLGKNPNPDKDTVDNYLFMPSIQCLDSVEEILHHRYRIFRYVINHHAVLRSNYILQKIIEKKLLDEIEKINKGELSLIKEDIIPTDLREVVDIAIELNEKEMDRTTSKNMVSRYVQLTDFWLFSTLNKDFVETLIKHRSTYTLQDLLLREVYQSKRAFKSIWKREHEFHQFYLKIGLAFNKKFMLLNDDSVSFVDENTENILKNICPDCKDFTKLITTFKNYLLRKNEIINLKSKIEEEMTYQKLTQARVKKLNDESEIAYFGELILRSIKIFDKLAGPKLMRKFENLFEKDYQYKVLISATKMKTGIKNCYLINRKKQTEVYNFEQFSRKAKSLQKSINNSIKFFVFFYDDGKITDETITNILIEYFLNEVKCSTITKQ